MDLISKLNRINEDKNKMISKLKSNMNLQLSNNLRKWPRQLYKYNNLEFRVNFYDYDGTVLYSYLNYEFLELDEMPPLPTRQGLICQGWNWDLDRAQEYVSKYGNLNIGATYTTDDGATRLYIELLNDNTEISLRFSQTVSNGVTINWGDETDETGETVSGTGSKTVYHTYSTNGEYIITLSVEDGCNISFGTNSSNYMTITPGIYLKKMEMGNSVTTIGQYAFYNCSSLRSITISDSVKTIGQYAFYNCSSLRSITISDSVKTIGNYAFYNCSSLQNVIIGNSVTSIGAYAFNFCYSLQNAVIGNSVTLIGNYAFSSCTSLQNITIPDGVTSIGGSVFYNCYSLQSITIPDSVTTIGNSAFSSCPSLQSVTIPDGVNSIGDRAFQKCSSLQSITIPDGVTSIGEEAFESCSSLQSITIPNSVTTIGSQAFYYCYFLQNIIIPDSVKSIDSYAFYNCHSIQSITIPKSVKSIGEYAFGACYSLQYIDFTSHTSIPSLGAKAFGTNPSLSDFEIWVPASLYNNWCNATNWSAYTKYIKQK